MTNYLFCEVKWLIFCLNCNDSDEVLSVCGWGKARVMMRPHLKKKKGTWKKAAVVPAAELDLEPPPKLQCVKLCINLKCNTGPSVERLDTFTDDRLNSKQKSILKHEQWEAHKLDDFFMMRTTHMLWQETPLPEYLTRALITLYTSAVSKGGSPFFLIIALPQKSRDCSICSFAN